MADSLALVSVLMPTWNAGHYIGEALDSIVAQTYKNIELVIVDDGSTDNTVQVIEKYLTKHSWIKYYYQKNSGVVSALNNGINLCQGDYIARADADDICRYTRLERQVDWLEGNSKVGVVGSWVQLFGDKSEVWHHRKEDNYIRNMMFFKTCGFSHSSVMFRKSVYKEFKYSSKYPHVEDMDIFLRINLESVWQFSNIPEVLVDYRVHSTQVSELYKKAQNECFHQLISKYIKHFYPEVSERELLIHADIYNAIVSKSEFELIEKGHWLLKLSKLTKAKLDDRYFVFKTKWLDYCLLHKHVPKIWNLYQSIDFETGECSLKEKSLRI